MVTQLHLALVMAIDAKLLVLDEPTLGLDILYRKQFYDSLLNDYFDRSRTIVVTTHQVEEVQHILTDLMFIDRGRIVFSCSMEDFESRYVEVMVNPEQVAAARALKPIHERQMLGRSILLFDRCRSRSPATGRARRGAHAQHRRFVRCRHGQSGRRSPRSSVMNTQSNAMPASVDSQDRACSLVGDAAPLLVGAARTLGEPLSSISRPLASQPPIFSPSQIGLPRHVPAVVRRASALDPALYRDAIARPYDFAGGLMMLTGILTASSIAATRCTANAAIAASCSGSRCRFRIGPPCWRKPAFR